MGHNDQFALQNIEPPMSALGQKQTDIPEQRKDVR
jgi:hypothetical protein